MLNKRVWIFSDHGRHFSNRYDSYWAIQVGLLTHLTSAWHHLSPLVAFTSSTFFTMEGSDSEFANFTLPTLKIFLEVRNQNVATSNNLLLVL